MKMIVIVSFLIIFIGLANIASAQTANNIKQSKDPWYNQGQAALAAAKARKPITGPGQKHYYFHWRCNEPGGL